MGTAKESLSFDMIKESIEKLEEEMEMQFQAARNRGERLSSETTQYLEENPQKFKVRILTTSPRATL